MQASLPPTRAFTLGAESARLSLRYDDPGNWTGGEVDHGALIGSQCGVSAPVLSEWLGRTATGADMRAVTASTMTAIFSANYWLRINADQLPAGADLMTADHGYNRGAATSAMVLQRLVGQQADGWIGSETVAAIVAWTPAHLDLSFVDAVALQEAVGTVQDGAVGPVTLAALAALPRRDALLACLYAAQVHDYRGLAAAPRNRGWFTRARARLAEGRKLTAGSAAA